MSFPLTLLDDLSSSEHTDSTDQDQHNHNRFGDYVLTKQGVFILVDGQPEYVCAPLMRRYNIDTENGQCFDGIVFRALNAKTCWYMPPPSQLRKSPEKVFCHLLDHGLDVAEGMDDHVIAFLRACQPGDTLKLTKQLGWQRHLNDDEALIFAKADNRHIASPSTQPVLVDTENTLGAHLLSAQGTLEDWQQAVAMPVCLGRHPLPLFALAASFAAPIQRFAVESDPFLLHYVGPSTTGKTTKLLIIASVWSLGLGSANTKSFLRSWSTTANAFEALAEEHMDIPMLLDEFGASAVADPQSLIYLLSGGQGKARMRGNGQRNPPKTWSTIVMSSGEASIIGSMGRKRPPDGVFHRLLEIEIPPQGIAPTQSNPERFARTLKTACSTYYGTAGPAFVQAIVERFSTRSEVERFVRECVEEVLTELLPQGHVKPMVERALRRFALICVAGEFAADEGILPISASEVRAAVKHVVATWLQGLARSDPSRYVVDQVRQFLLRHAARFQDIKAAKAPPIANRYGWVDHGTKLWYFTDDALEKAVPGMTAEKIAQVLKSNDLLNRDEKGRMKEKVTIRRGERLRFYTVLGRILDHDDSEAEAEAQGSTQTANVSWLSDAA